MVEILMEEIAEEPSLGLKPKTSIFQEELKENVADEDCDDISIPYTPNSAFKAIKVSTTQPPLIKLRSFQPLNST